MNVINVKSVHDLSSFYVVFNGSTMNERKGIYGISHLLEHLLCHQFDDIMDDLEEDGISWNAYTSQENIVFYMTGLDEYVKKYKKIILDRLLKYNITNKMFENEKKIVIEEYQKYFNNSQETNHALNLCRKIYDNYDAIGLKEDLENLKLKDIKDFYDIQFTKPHIIVNVSKYSPFSTDIQFSDKTFDKILEFGNYNAIIEPFKGRDEKTSIINLGEVITEDFPSISFIASMLGDGLKSPLYQEIREKRGLVYGLACGLDRYTPKSGVICVAAETSNKNVKEFQDVLSDVLSKPKKYLTKERFDIVKKSKTISYKKSEINRFNNVNKYIIPIEWQLEPVLDKIEYDQLLDIYDKYYNFNKWYKSIDSEEFK